jgi:hypothetical protein
MRHLYGVALAVLLAAAVFFGAAWGYMFATRGIEASTAANGSPSAYGGGLPAAGGSLFQNAHVMVGGGALLAVGLAAGLLMVIPWVSPLAAGLPGLVLVAWTVLYISDVGKAARLIPLKSRDIGAGFEALLFTGLLGAAGLAMIVPLFIPSRWRRLSRVPGYASPGESALAQPATASWQTGAASGTGGSGLDPTIAGFATRSRSDGDSNVLPDSAQTRPQQGPDIPPSGSQAPWGPPDQG